MVKQRLFSLLPPVRDLNELCIITGHDPDEYFVPASQTKTEAFKGDGLPYNTVMR
jgi:hypothetical protein